MAADRTGLWICSACHANLGEDFFTKAQRAKNDKARRCKGCIEAGNESRPIPAAPVAKARATAAVAWFIAFMCG